MVNLQPLTLSNSTVDVRDQTSMLPAELLAHIFTILVSLHPVHSEKYLNPFSYLGPLAKRQPPLPLGPLSWIPVTTHICKRWRAIALDTPSLWTRLVPSMGKAWNILSQRSTSALLSIEGWEPRYPGAEVMTACITSLLGLQHRIRELRLRGISQNNLDDLMAMFSQPLPHVTILCIHYIAPTRVGWEHAKMPANILSDMLSNLHELRLCGIEFPHETCLALLRDFDYHFMPLAGSTEYTVGTTGDVSKVINTLRGMPALRRLRLRLRLVESPLRLDTSCAITVPLPDLKDFTLSTGRGECWQIWSALRLSSFATVNIRCYDNTGSEELAPPAIQSHLASTPTAQSLSIRVSRASPYSDERLALAFDRPSQSREVTPPLDERTIVCIDMHVPSANEQLKLILAHISLDSIFTLRLGIAPKCEWNHETIRKLFLTARSATRIELSTGDGADILFGALAPVCNAERRTGNLTAMLFPALAVLRCTGVDFDMPLNHEGTLVPAHVLLARAIESRHTTGHHTRLSRLILDACRNWEEHEEKWKNLGVDVVHE